MIGFDYDFKNLETDQLNELSEAFKVIFGGSDTSRVWAFMRMRYPILKFIVRHFTFLHSLALLQPLTGMFPAECSKPAYGRGKRGDVSNRYADD